MSFIPDDTFFMGSGQRHFGELPAHAAAVEGLWIDKFTVTNEQFET